MSGATPLVDDVPELVYFTSFLVFKLSSHIALCLHTGGAAVGRQLPTLSFSLEVSVLVIGKCS